MSEKIDDLKKETVAIKKEVKEKTFGYIMGALSLVAGLAWNEAIKGVIDLVYPATTSGVWAKFVYAIVITACLTVIAVILAKFMSKSEKA